MISPRVQIEFPGEFSLQGPQGGASLIHDLPGDHTTDAKVVHEAFNKYFKHLHSVVVISDAHEQLNRECSVFTSDGRCANRKLFIAPSEYGHTKIDSLLSGRCKRNVGAELYFSGGENNHDLSEYCFTDT